MHLKFEILIYFIFSIHCLNCEKSRINEFKGESNNDFEYDYEEEYSDSDNELVINKNLTNDIISDTITQIFNNESKTDNFLSKLLSDRERISKIKSTLIENLSPIQDRINLKIFEFIRSIDLPYSCALSLSKIFYGMKNNELWAFKFFDSMGKIPSAVSEGVSSFFGDYDQCLNIESMANNHSKQFYGKYCLASPQLQIPNFDILYQKLNIHFLNNETNELMHRFLLRKINTIKLILANNIYVKKFSLFRIGLCIPSNCEAIDIQNAFNKIFQPILHIPIEVGPDCSVKHSKLNLNNHQIFTLYLLTIISLLVIISTTVELLMKRKYKDHYRINDGNKNLIKLLTTFSIIRNTKMLYTENTFTDKYQCFNTLFLGFVLWINLALYYIGPMTINLIGIKNIFSSFALDIASEPEYFFARTPFPFVTLYVFGGLYISLDFFSKKIELSLKNYVKFAIEKWIRFNSLCIGPILLTFILSITGDGPIWSLGELIYAEDCQNNWWKNMLFINTWIPGDRCNIASIYITNFFIFQIISPLVMIPYLYSKSIGIILNIILIIITSTASILPRLLGQPLAPFEVSVMNSTEEIKTSLMRVAFGPEQYITPFMAGILTGYLIIKNEKISKLFNSFRIFILWIIFITFCSLAIIWGENFKDINLQPNKLALMLWFTIGKIQWSIGCSSLIIALYFGKGFVYNILSKSIFRPITRLNVLLSLIHVILVYYRFFTIKENQVMRHSYIFECFIFDTIISYMISYYFYITIVSPVNNLFKYFKKPDIVLDINSNIVDNYECVKLNQSLEIYCFPDNNCSPEQ